MTAVLTIKKAAIECLTPKVPMILRNCPPGALSHHKGVMANFSMREAFNADPLRFEQFTLSSGVLFLDYSKNLITNETRRLLVELANQVHLLGAINAQLEGAIVNPSKNRPALHTALRRPVGDKLLVNG